MVLILGSLKQLHFIEFSRILLIGIESQAILECNDFSFLFSPHSVKKKTEKQINTNENELGISVFLCFVSE